jgi:hypothetical protein
VTRRDFVNQLAFEYASFEAANPDRKLQPLDSGFVFSVGRGYVETGAYTPRRSWESVDKAPFARAARKALPHMRRALAEQADEVVA